MGYFLIMWVMPTVIYMKRVGLLQGIRDYFYYIDPSDILVDFLLHGNFKVV